EDRYSHTDLWDLAANVEGSAYAVDLLRPALTEADPDLLAEIDAGFAEVDAVLVTYEAGDGYVAFTEVSQADLDKLKTSTAALSEHLSQVAGALGLEG
ncbi:MAG: hypothetical protein KDB33_04070, partial [Acidimicrobiales bacterium]|nr:hypothetical protein [Acidimicrobiales bacterium]